MNVAVLGGGSWASALVKILSENTNISIDWWVRKPEQAEHIRRFRRNPSYLTDVEFNIERVIPTSDIKVALSNASVVILAVPAAFLKDVLDSLEPEAYQSKIFVSAIKGMLPDNNMLISKYLQEFKSVDPANVCMISGPCHSEEVAMEKQSFLTIGGNSLESAGIVADLLACRYIRTSINNDLYGVETAAVLKNIYGIACGLARGLNYGDNFLSVLVANAAREMNILLNAVYPHPRDITESAYLGDLLVTCYSQFSRNRTLGHMVGRGYSVKSALIEMNMVAEGFYGVKCVHELNKDCENINLPIVKAVYNILYEKISPSIEFKILEGNLV